MARFRRTHSQHNGIEGILVTYGLELTLASGKKYIVSDEAVPRYIGKFTGSAGGAGYDIATFDTGVPITESLPLFFLNQPVGRRLSINGAWAGTTNWQYSMTGGAEAVSTAFTVYMFTKTWATVSSGYGLEIRNSLDEVVFTNVGKVLKIRAAPVMDLTGVQQDQTKDLAIPAAGQVTKPALMNMTVAINYQGLPSSNPRLWSQVYRETTTNLKFETYINNPDPPHTDLVSDIGRWFISAIPIIDGTDYD
jgi:hypothetical protein